METILLVNENKQFTEFLKFILEAAGYRVEVLENSLELFETVQVSQPGLVIIDTYLKYIDGLYLLERFKTRKEFASIPVLVVSTKNDPLSLIDSLERGAVNYLAAPINEDLLIDNVKKALAGTAA